MKFSSSYKYDKLPASKTIRLLDLKPAEASTDDIVCSLRQVALSEKPSYEALSYAWGDSKSSGEIQCDGLRIKISGGLEIALRYLRQADIRTLWIDAICINQKDTREREQQVRLMRDVYQNAWQVIAWIGEEKLEDSPALDIEKLQNVVIDPSEKEVAIKVENYITLLLRTMMSAITLMRRPWFSRAWIIQEAALSRGLVLQCGSKIIRWSNFLALLTLLPLVTDKEGVQVYFGEVFLERAQFVAKVRENIRARSDLDSTHGSDINVWQELESLVSRGRAFGASNPSDHVFALLGLVGQKVTKLIPVDYSLSYRVAYRDFTRMLIASTGSLTVLGQIDGNHDEKLESWVPDWSQPPTVDPLSSAADPFYKATGQSKVEMSWTENEQTLSLAGSIFDEIEHVYAGPSSEASETLSWAQRRIAKGTQFGLSESSPLLPYKSVSHLIPRAGTNSAETSSEQHPTVREKTIRRKPVTGLPTPTEDGSIDSMSILSLQSTRTDSSEPQSPATRVSTGSSIEARADSLTTLLARGIFTGLTRDPRVRQTHHIWGAIHPINGVYMQAHLENTWHKSLPKHLTYLTGEPMDDAYWKTLIGDKRTTLSLTSTSPPESWSHVFKVWHFMLDAKQGHVPRFAKEAPSKIFARAPLLASITSSSSNSVPTLASIQHQQLRDTFQFQNSERERLNRLSQLEVPAFRNILATLIAVHNTYHPDIRLASSIANDELLALLSSYGDLSVLERQKLELSLDALATAPLSDEELKYNIDKAFWYDFVRVARNRQFCVTKKGHIGWVPSGAEKGDKVCLLMGGQVPYVIRQHKKPKGEWMFLGEAYIHGAMKGEAMVGPGKVDGSWGKIAEIRLR